MKTVFTTGRPARDGESSTGFSKNYNSSPPTDWNYQATADFRGGAGSFGNNPGLLREFRSISSGFFNQEVRREIRIEAAIYGVLMGLASWFIGLAIPAACILLK